MADEYVTTGDLATYLRLGDSQDEAILADAVVTASRSVDGICGRYFGRDAAVSARVFPLDGEVAYVDDIATADGLIVATGNGTTFTTFDYAQLEPLATHRAGRAGWPYTRITSSTGYGLNTGLAHNAQVRVTAVWGWPAVPAPIRQATLILAAEYFKLSDAPLGVAGFGEFGVVRVRENPVIARLLDPYHHSSLYGMG